MYGLFYFNGEKVGELVAVAEKTKTLVKKAEKLGKLVKSTDDLKMRLYYLDEGINLLIIKKVKFLKDKDPSKKKTES